MNSKRTYWFPTKRYGWGWGSPNSWHGWAVFAAYLSLLGVLYYLVPPQENVAFFSIGVAVLTALLVTICWLKGEPPRWRWGGE